jgi:hypothetical protein
LQEKYPHPIIYDLQFMSIYDYPPCPSSLYQV